MAKLCMIDEQGNTHCIAEPIETIVLFQTSVSMVIKTLQIPRLGRATLTCKYT